MIVDVRGDGEVMTWVGGEIVNWSQQEVLWTEFSSIGLE